MKNMLRQTVRSGVQRIAGIMAVILLLFTVAGCGSGNEGSTNGAVPDNTDGAVTTEDTGTAEDVGSTDTAETPNDEELYEIVMIAPNFGTTPPGLTDVQAAVNEKIAHLGVKLTMYPMSLSDMATQTDLMIMNGDKLDLVMMLMTGPGNLVNKGSLLELDELYAQYGADIEKAEGPAIAGGYFQGKLYAIPSEEKWARSYGYFARKDILDELGMTFEPNQVYTLEDLEALFEAYKTKYGDSHYCIAQTSAASDFYTNMYPLDYLGNSKTTGVLLGAGLDDDMEVNNYYASEQFKAYAERMYRWAQAGYYSPDAATNTDAYSVQMQSGYYLGLFSSTETDMETQITAGAGTEMVKINLTDKYASTHMYQVSVWGIPVTCENPEKTFQFLNYLYGDNEVANMLSNGLEEVTYEVVEKGERPGQMIIKYVDGVTGVGDAPYQASLGIYGDKLNSGKFAPLTVDYYQMATEFNQSITPEQQSKALGYIFDSTAVATQKTAADAVVQQYVGMITCGTQDPATLLPEFLNALTAAGIDEIIEENRRQFAEWQANQ